MKKLFYFYLIIFGLVGYGQSQPINTNNNLSPDGLMDNIFDQYGNKYNLSDIKIEALKYSKTTNTAIGTSTTPLHCGYFDLYLEDGCGLNTTDPDYINRRNIITRVFMDLSDFIISPLSNPGNTTKVNIWIRNIANIPNIPSNVAGLASSFYSMPYNNNTSFGGIIDGEVWKTIHLGQDSYNNTISPLALNSPNSNASGAFYHGIVAFNFNNITWNTSLTATNISGLQDLYTVALHEITHALGFTSLINSSGGSKLGVGFNYFTRYDTKLKNFSQSAFLLSNIGACNSMYNYSFNSGAPLSTTILQPTATPYCNNTIKYVGTSVVPVYTPSTFSDGSSLSHFEPQCVSPIPNFVMDMSTPYGVIRRYLTPQERNALGDIGYSVKTTFGVNTTYQGTTTYTGTITGIPVAGINDGIDSAGQYSYYGVATSTSPITINSSSNTSIRILSNDYNATGFECLQDVFDSTARFNGTLTSVSSTSSSFNVNYTTSVPGIHLLRYVPINGSQKGNITYIYVYVKSNTFCGTTNTCDLIRNGNFETHSATFSPNQGIAGDILNACNWERANNSSPNYLTSDFFNTSSQSFNVPCGDYGYEQDKILNNHAFAGIGIQNINPNNDPFFTEPIFTQLESNLLPSTTYQLSFDVSLAEGYSSAASKIQAYFDNNFIPSPTSGGIANAATNTNGILLTTLKEVSKTEGWEKIIFNFTTTSNSNQNTLCIGGITNQVFQSNIPAPPNVHGCNYSIFGGASYYYVDNVSLIPLNGGSFTLPTSICNNQTIPNLKTYLSGLPLTGVFSGPGISISSGIYKFNAAIVPLGVNTISYTYTNSSNCSVIIYCNITVLQAPTVPVITGSVSVCTTSSPTKTYSTTLGTGETATWSVVSGAGAGTIANPNNTNTNITWTTLPASLKLTITNSAGCSSSTIQNIGSVCSTCSCLANLTLTKSIGINGSGLYLTIGGNICTQDFVTDSIDFGDGSPLEYDNGGYSYHQYITSGNYTVTYTITLLGGCTATAKFLISAVGCSTCDPASKINTNSIHDVIENNQYKMEVNPNPTNGFLNVRINNYVGKVNIQVIDINGRIVSEYKNEDFNIEKSLNLNNLQTGMYVLKVSGDSLNFTQKIMKN